MRARYVCVPTQQMQLYLLLPPQPPTHLASFECRRGCTIHSDVSSLLVKTAAEPQRRRNTQKWQPAASRSRYPLRETTGREPKKCAHQPHEPAAGASRTRRISRGESRSLIHPHTQSVTNTCTHARRSAPQTTPARSLHITCANFSKKDGASRRGPILRPNRPNRASASQQTY